MEIQPTFELFKKLENMKYMCVNMGSKGTQGLGTWRVNGKMPPNSHSKGGTLRTTIGVTWLEKAPNFLLGGQVFSFLN